MERCGFFDANLVGDEYDRVYLAEQFSAYFASFIGNGIFAGKSNELQVLSMEAPAMQIRVQEGQGWINGYWYENMSELYLPIEVADGVLSRVDSVVLRLGMTERNMWIAVKKGVPSYNPVAPEVTRNDDYFELQLDTIWIGAGYTNIKQSDITDTRLISAVCGLVAGVVQQIDTTTFGNQLQTFINEYMARADAKYEAYKDKLSELEASAIVDKNNYLADLQALYKLCENAYQDFLAYLASLKSNGNKSLEDLKAWIESLKLESSTEINRLIEELRGVISEDIVSQLILRLTDLEQEMPKKIPMPVESDLTKGLIFLKEDGTTKLVHMEEPFKYSIVVDNGADANPAAIEYGDDCSNFVPASGSNMNDWADTLLYKEYFKPCVIGKNDSEPKYFLQKDNMSLKEDGTPAVLDGTDGDVMIQVKKLYGKAIVFDNSFKLIISNQKVDDSYFCFNEIDGEEKEYVYIASFEAFAPDYWNTAFTGSMNALVSVKSLVQDADMSTFHDNDGYASSFTQVIGAMASDNGNDYTETGDIRGNFYSSGLVPQGYLGGWYFKTFQLYQWMSMFLYKTRNLQDNLALGPGFTLDCPLGINYLAGTASYGTATESPFCSGGGGGYVAAKFLGVENFYGNTMDYIEGVNLKLKREENDGNIMFHLYARCSSRPSTYSFKFDDYDEEIYLFSFPFSNDSGNIYRLCFNKFKFFDKSKFAFPCIIDGENTSTDTFWCDDFRLTRSVVGDADDGFLFVSVNPAGTHPVSSNGPFAFYFTNYCEETQVEAYGTFRLFRYK